MSPKSTFESPVNKLPYDLLREIFLRCLSENPLYDAQPDTTIAPMLLCHVCSSWRAVALMSASLWSHLYVRLPLLWEGEGAEEIKLVVRSKVAFTRDLEFLPWWRKNQGSVALFLRLDVHRSSWNGADLPFYTDLPSENEDFLFEYLSPAHYLDVGELHPYLVHRRLRRGFPVSFPSLRTLVITSYLTQLPHDDNHQNIATLRSQIPSTTRRLSIRGYSIPRNHNVRDWSALTHISLDDVYISSFHTWFTMIRTLVDLQWGYFYLLVVTPHTIVHPPNLVGVLAKLSTLHLAVYILGDHDASPLSTLLHNMEFPALRTLSLTSSAKTWTDSRAIIDVHSVLRAAPAVTKLTLGLFKSQGGFLCFANGSDLPTVVGRRAPLLTYAPNLSHLQVEFKCPNESDGAILAKDYIKRFFRSKRWLGLANPMSKIRKVTIVIKAIPWDVDSEFEGILKALLKWNIRKYIKAETNVSFEIASEAEQGVRNLANAWMIWGSTV